MDPKKFPTQIFLTQNISNTIFLDSKKHPTQIFFLTQTNFRPKFFWPTQISDLNFFDPNFRPKSFDPKRFPTQIFFARKFFGPNSFDPKQIPTKNLAKPNFCPKLFWGGGALYNFSGHYVYRFYIPNLMSKFSVYSVYQNLEITPCFTPEFDP